MRIINFDSTILRYYLFSFFRDLSFVNAVLIPFYTDWGKISIAQIFILQSWFGLWILLLEVPTGAIADRFGRKFSIVLGAFIVTIAALVYGSAPRIEIFMLAEFLYALAFALTSGADHALIYDYLKGKGKEKEVTNVYGKAQSFHLFGLLIAGLLGGTIASKFGLNAPMLLSAVPFLLSGLIILTIKETNIFDKTLESKRYLTIAKEGFVFFYKHKILRILAFDAVLVTSAAHFVVWLYQLLLKQINIPIEFYGLFSAILMSSEILISSNFQKLEKVFGSKKNLLKYGALITALSFILLSLKINIYTILVFLILGGGFGITRITLMNAYMNKHIPSDKRATVLSSVSMLRRLIIIIIFPIVGFMADKSLSLTFLAISILPLFVLFFSKLEEEMLD